MPESPYKFLAPYLLEDEAIFFGRARETQVLLADIVINRLVVLFAKTGTGKTSLINAGVRPRLHDRDYQTFFIRVRKDPTESARTELAEYDLKGKTLSAQLSNLSERLNKSIVLFFDQFEEFFIHIGGSSPKGREFIAEIGTLYKAQNSGVHVVFSMREEFLYYMDYFWNEIPSIFRSDSTLRLRGFDRVEAEEAITGPANYFGYRFDPKLITRLIDDLIVTGKSDEYQGEEIEPTQLQIVCDTIWQKKTSNLIIPNDYLKLGDEGLESNIAQQILDQRLENELAGIEDDTELQLLDKLLPLLRTEKNTKDVRDVHGLCEKLNVKRSQLDPLLRDLKKSRLIQESGTGDAILIELTHDYLADAKRIASLQDSVRNLWLKRIRERGEFVGPEDLERIRQNLSEWRLNRSQARFLFRSALAHGWELRQWFDLAAKKGIGVWEILKEKIDSGNEVEAVNAVDLLRELPELPAIKLLGGAMKRKSLAPLAGPALSAAAQSRNPDVSSEAKRVLARLDREDSQITEPLREWLSSNRPPTIETSSSPGGPPYGLIRNKLFEGRIIPFLGVGASLSAREAGANWKMGARRFLPSAGELALHLAERAEFPFRDSRDLTNVAQYYSVVGGRRALNEELHHIFDFDYQVTPLHTFLASISVPLLIVTTNYDDLIERALDEKNQLGDSARPYDVVIHTTEGGSGDRLLWWPYGASAPREVNSNKLDIDLEERTVIYKMHGAVDRKQPSRDQYVITEDDYIDFLARMTKNKAIPAIFAEPFQMRPFLFLGYQLDQWSRRVVLNRIEKDLRRSKSITSWAIERGLSPLERRYWQERAVECYDLPIEEFVTTLASE